MFFLKCHTRQVWILTSNLNGCRIWITNSLGVVFYILLYAESESEVSQSCPTLCDPIDCSLPVSSVHGIFQARVLEWAAISFSRGSSRPRDRTPVSLIVGRYFTILATRDALCRTEVYIVTFHLHGCGFCFIVSWGFLFTKRNLSVMSEDVIFQRTRLTWKSFT